MRDLTDSMTDEEMTASTLTLARRSCVANLAQLRELLQKMEGELGLCELSHNERDVLYAVHREIAVEGVARTERIRENPLARGMSQPTFHRVLKSLLEKGLVQMAPNRKNGVYILK